jgi:hypothetical protein
MKNLIVTLLFLLTSFLGFGQSVSAPDSKSFLPSTSGQNASGFLLSGFSSTDVVLASISLVNPPTGTTFNLGTTLGLTAASGFTLAGNKTRLVVTGTMANINTALASLKVNTGSVKGNVQLSVAATINPTGYYYNGVNGHFYRPITTGNTYTGARAAAEATTFKGQTGYLVTITSADEDNFIQLNVPQQNIWIALTDEVTEGRWIIDAGPEKGTLIKTSNGQLNGNIQGQYNNWAGGEPNNSGNEDYTVTKWGGGSQWNDLPNNFYCAYVIEYGTWTNPDDATFTEFYTNSVIHSNGDVLRAQFTFDFGTNIDETKFGAVLLAQSNNQYLPTTNTNRTLNGLGRVDMTNDLDTAKVLGNGYRSLTTPGEVEWAIIDVYSTNFGGHRLYIDSREFDGTGVSPSDVNSIKLFDIYDGPITYVQDAGGWKIFRIVPNISTKITSSTYQQYLRLQNGWYGTRAEFSFTPTETYKAHGIQLTTTNNISSLYNSIVTVSDVWLAFKEVSNGGIFGDQSGLEFTNGIQYMNGDVDGNGVFNETDAYKLLQHLTGVETIGNGSTNLSDYMKIYLNSEYDAVTKTNWNTQTNTTRNEYTPINLSSSTLNNSFGFNVTWKGDVNLSHSAQQSVSGVSANSVRVMSLTTNSVSNEINASIVSEIINDKVVVYISIDPLQQELVGTQFQLNYDNSKLKFEKVDFVTKGNPTNYGSNRGSYISLGSLITSDGLVLDNTTEYRITFTPINRLTDILGLISISTTDAVNKNGNQLKIKLN